MVIVVLYTDLLFQLPPTLTISSAAQVRGSDSIGYEVCGYAAKDHSKINEGEGKEIWQVRINGQYRALSRLKYWVQVPYLSPKEFVRTLLIKN